MGAGWVWHSILYNWLLLKRNTKDGIISDISGGQEACVMSTVERVSNEGITDVSSLVLLLCLTMECFVQVVLVVLRTVGLFQRRF